MIEYQGVKFKIIHIPEAMKADQRIKKMIVWARIFHDHNLAPAYEGGSFGNLSFRIEPEKNSFFITASHTALDQTLSTGNFVQINNCDPEINTVTVTGSGEPSSETLLHHAIYQARPDVNCIMHGHCREILANSANLKLPATEKAVPYGTKELVQAVLKLINEGNFLIMKDHGFLSLGNTIADAGNLVLEMLDKCSKKNSRQEEI
ncbi:MAG: hypothetical protein APR54_04225 [Candidatus Cloacimonas sp. SDB]|nr:MAG: hypothetical protein APR54_04225 [Candidatus Cloacimonas sp. SDB]